MDVSELVVGAKYEIYGRTVLYVGATATPDMYEFIREDTGNNISIYSETIENQMKPKNISTKKEESINHPNHYGGDDVYETIKVIDAWGLDKDFYLGNVVKYISRAGKKGSTLEDLKKALWYLQRKVDNYA